MKTSKTIKIAPELEKLSEIVLNSDEKTITPNIQNVAKLLNQESLVLTRFSQEFRRNIPEFMDIFMAHQEAYEEIEKAYNWFLDFYTKHPINKEMFFDLDTISNNLFIYPKENIYSARIVMNKLQVILKRYIAELGLEKDFNRKYRKFYNYFLIGTIDQVIGEEYPPYSLGLNKHFKSYSKYLNQLYTFENSQKSEPWYSYFYIRKFIDYTTNQKTTPNEISHYIKPLPIRCQNSNEDNIEGYSIDEIKSAWIGVYTFLKKQDRHRDMIHYENGIIYYKDNQLALLEDSTTRDIFEFLYRSPEEEYLVEGVIKGIKDEATNEGYNELKKETVYQLIKSLNERATKAFEIPVFIKPSKKVIKIDSSLLR